MLKLPSGGELFNRSILRLDLNKLSKFVEQIQADMNEVSQSIE
jgi:hypothetical protein